MDAAPSRFRSGIVEIGGVAGGEHDVGLVLAQGKKRAVVNGDAVIAFRYHPSPFGHCKTRLAFAVGLDDDIAHELNRVGFPKHIALVVARNFDGLCRKPSRQQQSHSHSNK